MTRFSAPQNVVAPQSAPNVYTALLAVAIVVLLATVAIVMHNLMASPPNGYGLSFGDIFSKLELPK
jgi:hypothetical protein